MRSSKSPARVTSNHDAKASTRSMPSGRPDRPRWIGPTASWSSDSSTSSAMTDPSVARRCPPATGAGRCGPSRSGGGRRRPPPVRSRRRAWTAAMVSGSSSTQSWWTTPSSSTASTSGWPSRSKVALSPSVMERPQIGDRLARVAANRSSRSVLALGRVCSWGRMSAALASSMASAPMTPLVAAPPGDAHPVGVEGRRRVTHQHLVLLPLLQQPGRMGVAVEAGPVVGLGQLDADRVGAVACRQPGPLVRRDHVVGRGDDRGRVDPRRVVAQAGKGREPDHGAPAYHTGDRSDGAKSYVHVNC